MRRNVLASPKRRRPFKGAKYGPGKGRPKRDGQYIDPAKFVNEAVPAPEQERFVPNHKFTDFGFMPELERNVVAKGYEHPTPVQDGAIKPVMEGKDMIGIANTGTGKTAAFLLPIIHRMKTHQQPGTALIIAPTRELAVQIDEEFRGFAKGLGLHSVLCLGGMNVRPQIKGLKRDPQVVIGTPGRLKDLFQQKALRLNRTGVVVLDEADRMLDMGFIKDITFLLDQLPKERQSLCFSATIPPQIGRLLDTMLKDPVTVSVRTRETADQVEQNVIKARSKEEKISVLRDLLRKPEFDKVLIFGRTKWSVQKLADTLKKSGIQAEAIHGNKSQPQRQRALKAFSSGKVNVLVATDVASRGLDIPDVSHVINFDQPNSHDDYIHRIGRTGRAGKGGHALTFVAG
ncbi:DEAD/DEAH box helicase [Patescibacteria group bacterium]|nr:DEAD/DEAH box helicase [Patescibacteria group bacterium]